MAHARITYTCSRGTTTTGLCSIHADGTGRVSVVSGPFDVDGGELSPDGSRVAYFTGPNADSQMWVADADGSHPVNLGPGGDPSWSPDGGRLVYTRSAHAPGGIWSVNVDGTGARQVSPAGRSARWSPNGRQILMVIDPGDRAPGVYRASPEGGAAMLIIPNGTEAAWSPDGTRIAFTSNPTLGDGSSGVRIANADGSSTRVLDHPGPAVDLSPSWSPDGASVLVARADQSAGEEFVAVKADGSGERPVIKFLPPDNGSSPRWGGGRALSSTGGGESCAGQMVDNNSLRFEDWTMQWGLSKCEGLVVSNVALGGRLMAERMSVPYVNVDTCQGPNAGTCGPITTRHVVLQPEAQEPQIDPAAYTHVRLEAGYDRVTYAFPSTGLCFMDIDKRVCNHVIIKARYRIDLAPPTAGPAQNYLLVTQQYEFYHDFNEGDTIGPILSNREVACEPSKDTGVMAGALFAGSLAAPLDDCGRWKPLVTYQYVGGTSGQALVRVNVAARLHFTPDATAIRATAFFRDCEPAFRAPFQCADALGHLEELFQQTALQPEAIVRAYSDSPAGVVEGRFDNLHQTPANDVLKPGLNFTPAPHVAAGCPECVHMHWRWGKDILDDRVATQLGNGQPLVVDAEPGALPATGNQRCGLEPPAPCPNSKHQQLDVAQVAYHSEELTPSDYSQLVVPGVPDAAVEAALNTFFVPLSGELLRGSVPGNAERLESPSGSCSAPNNPSTWGQCGQVTWLSATSFNDAANDETSDTLFAFGGFFCGTCGNQNYTAVSLAAHPYYVQSVPSPQAALACALSAGRASLCQKPPTLKSGQAFHILFANPTGTRFLHPGAVRIYDELPAGSTRVSGEVTYLDTGGLFGVGAGPQTVPCNVTSASSGAPLVQCTVPDANISFDIVHVSATAPSHPGTVTNTVHATWGSDTSNSEFGGNYRTTDALTFGP